MKRFVYCLMAACSILQFVGCEKADNEPNVLVETNPTPVFFIVKDTEGNNLLDADYDGNILNNDITITVNNGATYSITTTESAPNSSTSAGLYLGNVKVENIDTPCLEYWFIHHTDGDKRQHFRIDWGDGTSDIVEVSYYFTTHNQGKDIVSHKTVWVNGELNNEDSFIATIVKADKWATETDEISELVNGCKDFDAETLLVGLEGKWMLDSLLIYDDEWAKITTPLLVMGEDYVDGRAYSYFTFAADGTGYRYVNYPEPDMEPETLEFNWTYDTESRKLKLTGDYKNEWSVTGYSNDYIVLDQISREGWNYRTILKRQAEGDVPTVISYMEYTLSGTQCEWQLPLLNNNAIIVDSDEDLTKYITSENGDSYPYVDFTKYTMIIANGGTPQGISDVIIDSFQQITEAEYNLNIRVLMTMTDAPELWVKALLVDKWDRPSTVNLNVEIIGQ